MYLLISIDRGSVSPGVAHNSNSGVYRVLPNGGATGTRTGTVAETIDFDNASIRAFFKHNVPLRNRSARVDSRSRRLRNGFGKRYGWESERKGENWRQRDFHRSMTG